MKRILLRKAGWRDCKDIWRWRNHAGARKHFFDTSKVSLTDHKKWFRSKLDRAGSSIYIAKYDNRKIGVIRFDIEGRTVKVSVCLNPDFCYKGFGPRIIRLGTKRFHRRGASPRVVLAEIKNSNMASLKAFSKAGYKRVKRLKDRIIYRS